MSKQRFAPDEFPLNAPGIRVEQEFVGVAAQSHARRPRPMQSETIFLARTKAGEISVPALSVQLRKIAAGLATVVVEEAELYAVGNARKQGKVDAGSVVDSAKGIRFAATSLHIESKCRFA